MKKFNKSKVIIPALAMIALTTAASATGTVAWFSANATVTASTIQFKATAEANLYIEEGNIISIASMVGTSATLTANNTIKPCDMSDIDSGTVTVRKVLAYKSGKDATVDYAGEADTWTSIGTLTTTTKTDAGNASDGLLVDNYVSYGFVTIARKQTTTGKKFQLTPTVTVTLGSNSDLNKSIRAGIIINGAKYESNDPNTATGSATFTFSTITGLDDNTCYQAALMMWFEGEDEHCTANNAATISSNTATFSFKSADYSAS